MSNSLSWIVAPDRRHLYGRQDMEVLATNIPSWMDENAGSRQYSAEKELSIVANREFEVLFADVICDSILAAFKLRHPLSGFCSLHVFRMGFNEENPIVIHLLVRWNALSPEEASTMVSEIDGAMVSAGWTGEKVYTDVCQTISGPEIRSSMEDESGNETGIDLTDEERLFYKFSPPQSGSSIGASGKSEGAGTLMGYVRHEDKIFAVTNEHVVRSRTFSDLKLPAVYRYQDGRPKLNVVSPTYVDGEFTFATLRKRLNVLYACQDAVTNKRRLKVIQASCASLEEDIVAAKAYDPKLGYIYATSGRCIIPSTFRFDWAIIHCPLDPSTVRNKHPELNPMCLATSGMELLAKAQRSLQRVLCVSGSVTAEDWIARAIKYFQNGPDFKTVNPSGPEAGKVYLKPPSRTCLWKSEICNGVKATLNLDNVDNALTKEWCFLNPDTKAIVTKSGDSGSVFVDDDFQPTAMTWGGTAKNPCFFQDVTYATPLFDILRNIEFCMGWAPDSVVLC